MDTGDGRLRRTEGCPSIYLWTTMTTIAFAPVDEQWDLISKGVAEILPVEALRERLGESMRTGVPLRVKAGFDPTFRIWGTR